MKDPIYDEAYFAKYVEYARTSLGQKLNTARLALVRRHFNKHGTLVDVGIGCGQFVLSDPTFRGYDVNPAGLDWLAKHDRWCDPYQRTVDVATAWDALEHIESPTRLLANVDSYLFASVPIFRDVAHVLSSRHFRPSEHYWYWTDAGFVYFMREHGFALLERNNMESQLGREDIGSYAFKRVERK